jgi:hypothetical protein
MSANSISPVASAGSPAAADSDPEGYGSIGDNDILDAIELDLAPEPEPAPRTGPKPAAPKPASAAPSSPATVAAPKAEPEAPKHPDWMVEQAAELGIEDDLVGSLDTANLGKLITRELKRERAEARTAAKAEAVAPPVPSDPVAAFWSEQGEVDDEGKIVKVKDVQFHPALKKVLDAIVKDVHGLKGHAGKTEEQTRAQQEAAVQAEFDAAFAKREAVFAAGDAATVKAASPKAFLRRKAVYAEVMARQWPKGTSIEAAVATVANEMFEEAEPVPAQRAVKPKANAYVDNTVARPTRRAATDKPKGKQKAQEAADRWFEENGVDESDPDDGDPDAEY